MIQKSHGLTSHRYFRRWSNIAQRCYNPNATSYAKYGGRGIRIDECWSPDNVNGVANFLIWIEAELVKHPKFLKTKFYVGREDVNKNFNPENCKLVSSDVAHQHKRTKVLTFEKVVAVRRYKKAHPKVTLAEMAKIFKQGVDNLSRCIRGITWANVDGTEAPIESFANYEKSLLRTASHPTSRRTVPQNLEV